VGRLIVYFTKNVSGVMGWAEHVGRVTGMINAFKMMVEKSEGKGEEAFWKT
jgi:hypothetical protein